MDINEDGPDDVEGLDVAAAHVANLLSNEPADSKFSLQTCLFIPLRVVPELVRGMSINDDDSINKVMYGTLSQLKSRNSNLERDIVFEIEGVELERRES